MDPLLPSFAGICSVFETLTMESVDICSTLDALLFSFATFLENSYIGLPFKFAVICKTLGNMGHSYIGISLIFAAFQTSNDIFALGLVHALQKYPREKARKIAR